MRALAWLVFLEVAIAGCATNQSAIDTDAASVAPDAAHKVTDGGLPPAADMSTDPSGAPDLFMSDASALPDQAAANAGDAASGDGGSGDGGDPRNPLLVARPYLSHVPPSYDPAKPTALLLLLHGYNSTGVKVLTWYDFAPVADANNVLIAYPDGTKDKIGIGFWNATDACCNLFGSTVDDVAYLTAVLDDMAARYNVDPKRVFVAGHSNGSFMSHRMACELSPRIAAIVAFAGDDFKDTTKCHATTPVSVLQVHGDADAVIHYPGGNQAWLGQYPAAPDSVLGWAKFNGCALTPDNSAPNVDIAATIAGAETSILRYPGCKPGGAAELWTVKAGPHQPTLSPGATTLFWNFLAAHPKP